MNANKQTPKEKEILSNYGVFQQLLPSVLISHKRQIALMRHGEVVGYYNSPSDAIKYGKQNFTDKLFSTHRVESSDEAVEFGWLSQQV